MAGHSPLFRIWIILPHRNIFHYIQAFFIQIQISQWLWVHVCSNFRYCRLTTHHCFLFDFVLQILSSQQIYGWTQLYGNISNAILLHIRIRWQPAFRIRCLFCIPVSAGSSTCGKYSFDPARYWKRYNFLCQFSLTFTDLSLWLFLS